METAQMRYVKALLIANTDCSYHMHGILLRQSQGCWGTAGVSASWESTLTWLFLSLALVFWQCQLRKLYRGGRKTQVTQPLQGTADLGSIQRTSPGSYSSTIDIASHPNAQTPTPCSRNHFIQRRTIPAKATKAEIRTQFCRWMFGFMLILTQ